MLIPMWIINMYNYSDDIMDRLIVGVFALLFISLTAVVTLLSLVAVKYLLIALVS